VSIAEETVRVVRGFLTPPPLLILCFRSIAAIKKGQLVVDLRKREPQDVAPNLDVTFTPNAGLIHGSSCPTLRAWQEE
jgi:hypothetical protein